MNTLIQTSIKRPRKDLIAKPFRSSASALILIALAIACSAVSPAALAGNPHGSPTPTPTPSPTPVGDRGNENTAIGDGALFNLTSGVDNTAMGFQALFSNTTGSDNTANGFKTLFSNTTGFLNTATGSQALFSNTGGIGNTASGFQALLSNITGGTNTATGVNALLSNTNGDDNTANGVNALYNNTSGVQNTATGAAALYYNTTGNYNTAEGIEALEQNTTGNYNTASGFRALYSNTTGSGNIALGFNAGSGVTTASNVTAIGIAGQDVANSCYIGRIFGATSSGGTAVFINADGRLGTATSSKRFKEDIKPMNNASETLLALKPVTFRYKNEIDPQGTPQFGLVAEEVEKVNPKLVVRDKEGKVNTVRYEAVNAMLLNEFLKEHKKVEQLKATVAQQRNGMEVLATQLKEQTMQIQKVAAQIEMSKFATGRIRRGGPASRVVANKP